LVEHVGQGGGGEGQGGDEQKERELYSGTIGLAHKSKFHQQRCHHLWLISSHSRMFGGSKYKGEFSPLPAATAFTGLR
jgi:hypothetical protein